MEISENEKAAFFAGIIEGEGTISIVKWADKRTPGRTSVTLSPRIAIGNNDLRLIEHCQAFSGGGIYKSERDLIRKGHRGRFPVYYLTISGHRHIVTVLKKISNYLVGKAREAELMTEFCEARLNNGGAKHPYSERQYKIYDELVWLHNGGRQAEYRKALGD